MLHRFFAKITRSARFQAFIARASSLGSAPTLSTPCAPLFGEGEDPQRRIMELEAERNALSLQLAELRKRLEEAEPKSKH